MSDIHLHLNITFEEVTPDEHYHVIETSIPEAPELLGHVMRRSLGWVAITTDDWHREYFSSMKEAGDALALLWVDRGT